MKAPKFKIKARLPSGERTFFTGPYDEAQAGMKAVYDKFGGTADVWVADSDGSVVSKVLRAWRPASNVGNPSTEAATLRRAIRRDC